MTELIFSFAELVKDEDAVGFAAIGIGCAFLLAVTIFLLKNHWKKRVIDRIRKAIEETSSGSEFSKKFDEIHGWISAEQQAGKVHGYDYSARRAWDEYAETLVTPDEKDDDQLIRNTVRPSFFFNSHDLGFEHSFWRYLSGIFVSIGLLLTFLGIIAALGTLENINQDSMSEFLAAARGKFIMSLAGLLASILFSMTYRLQSATLDRKIAQLCNEIEFRVCFQTSEKIAIDQLKATQEQASQLQVLGNDLGAQIGKSVSQTLTRDLAPILDKVGSSARTEVSGMVEQISDALNAKLDNNLEEMSRTLSTINRTLEGVVGRLTSSGDNIGAEMSKGIKNLNTVVDNARRQLEADQLAARNASEREQEASHQAIASLLESIAANTRDNDTKMTEAAHSITTAAEGLAMSISVMSDQVSEKASAAVAEIGYDVNQKVAVAGADITRQLADVSGDFIGGLANFQNKLDTTLVEPIRTMAVRLESSNRELEKHALAMNQSTLAQERSSTSLSDSSKSLEGVARPIADSVERIERTNSAIRTSLEGSLQMMEASRATVDQTMTAMQTCIGQMKDVVANAENIDDKLGAAFQQIETSFRDSQDHIRRFSEEVTTRFSDGIQSIQTVLDGITEFEPARRGV